MINPATLPPSSTWEEHINTVLHSGYAAFNDPETLSRAASAPAMPPWPIYGANPDLAVTIVLSAIQAKQVAATIPEGGLQAALNERADRTIVEMVDDICGTGPHGIPWPWPGPPPWAFAIVARLAAVGNSIQDDGVRHTMIEIAGRITQNIYASTGVGNPP
jgi:hypothetical protein